jgi:hypothetical protein
MARLAGGLVETFPRVVALVSAYNEADVIGQVIGYLVQQGVEVYLIDDASTDGTVEAAEPYLNRGLLRIEQRAHGAEEGRFSWSDILARKETLATELDADWFIHHDADEFRESPWAGLSLREAIGHVDRRGYNAIDFQLLNFRPTDTPGPHDQDVRSRLTAYELPGDWDRLQVKCWKKTSERADLITSGGHDVHFEGRRVFPIRFLLRHYPIRSQSHGERKVFVERKPRFTQAERDRQWHVQYDDFQPGGPFTWAPARLLPYDPDSVRVDLTLQHRDLEHLAQRAEAAEAEATRLRREKEQVEQALADREDHIQRLAQQLEMERAQALQGAAARDEQARALAQELAGVYDSRSWRLTQPLRTLARLVTGR